MKPAASYSRVSTAEQAESGYSLKTQVAAARKYAGANNLDLDESREFVDDYTGALLARPGLIRLRELVTLGKIGAVIVYSADRLSRNLGHLIILREEFQHHNIEIHYVRGGKRENTAEARLLDNVEGTIGEYEREKIAERTMRGKIAKAQSGKPIARPPYGYQLTGAKAEAHLVVIEREAAIVREVFNLYLRGENGSGPMGTRAIAARLTERREPTQADAMGRPRKTHGRGFWHNVDVGRVLRQPAYIGKLLYRGIEISVPPIISADDWKAAQVQIKRNYELSPRHATPGKFLLSGLIYCGCGCGQKFIGVDWGRGSPLLYMSSFRHDKQLADGRTCKERSISAERIESEAWAYFVEMVESDALEGVVAEWVSHADELRATKIETIARVATEIAGCEADAARLADIVAAGGVVGTALKAKADMLNQRHDALVKERDKMWAELDDVPSQNQANAAIKFRNGIRRVFARTMTRARMREYLRASMLRVVVKDGRGTFSFTAPEWMMYPARVIMLTDTTRAARRKRIT